MILFTFIGINEKLAPIPTYTSLCHCYTCNSPSGAIRFKRFAEDKEK